MKFRSPGPNPTSVQLGPQIALALAAIAAATGLGLVIRPWVADADVIMLFLLALVVVAYHMTRIPSVVAALSSVVAFNFFFVAPHHTFAVYELQYVLTFVVMGSVALSISGLTAKIKGQAAAAQRRERTTATLYEFSHRLAIQTSVAQVRAAAVEYIEQTLGVDAAIEDVSHPTGEEGSHRDKQGQQFAVRGLQQSFGRLIVQGGPIAWPLAEDDEIFKLLSAQAEQLGLFLERFELAKKSRQARLELETEKMRNAMLASVSHDLRTPLTSIMGAASTLTEPGRAMTDALRHQLAGAIFEESRRLNRLLENLLKMTRIEGGSLTVSAEWQLPSEILGSALSHLDPELADRDISVDRPAPEEMAKFDGPLIEQCLVNLVENALQYSPSDTPLEVAIEYRDKTLIFRVADYGPGVDPAEQAAIFDKFYQGASGAERGSGLGLTICRAIVEAHGGQIQVQNRAQQSGAIFSFSLPQTEEAPAVPPTAADAADATERSDD